MAMAPPGMAMGPWSGRPAVVSYGCFMARRIDRWVDEQMHRWIDAWIDRKLIRWMDRWVDGWMVG